MIEERGCTQRKKKEGGTTTNKKIKIKKGKEDNRIFLKDSEKRKDYLYFSVQVFDQHLLMIGKFKRKKYWP